MKSQSEKLQKIEELLSDLYKDSEKRFHVAEQRERFAQQTPELQEFLASRRTAKIEAWYVMITLKSISLKIQNVIHE